MCYALTSRSNYASTSTHYCASIYYASDPSVYRYKKPSLLDTFPLYSCLSLSLTLSCLSLAFFPCSFPHSHSLALLLLHIVSVILHIFFHALTTLQHHCRLVHLLHFVFSYFFLFFIPPLLSHLLVTPSSPSSSSFPSRLARLSSL